MNEKDDKNDLKFSYKWTILDFNHFYDDLENDTQDFEPPLSVLYSNKIPPCSSDSGECCDFQFVLRLLLKFSENENMYISVFLYLDNCKLDFLLDTEFQISIIDINEQKINTKNDRKQFAKENCFGFEKFMLINKEFLQTNSNLILFCEINVKNYKRGTLKMSKEILKSYNSETNAKFVAQNLICRWSIKDFSNYILNSDDGKAILMKSPQFFSPENKDVGFFILIVNNSNKDFLKDYISAYLYFTSDVVDKMTISYQISILDYKGCPFRTGEGQCEMMAGENGAKGSPKFITRDEIIDPSLGLLPRNTLTIVAKINCIQVQTKLSPLSSHFENMNLTGNSSLSEIKLKSNTESLPEYNVLLLGDIGAGKSTSINSWANYLKFKTFEEAEEGNLEYLIPVKIKFWDQEGEPTDLFYGINRHGCELFNDKGYSVTQFPSTYTILLKDKILRIIDTPGFGDPRGESVDRENIGKILVHLQNYKQLHAIVILFPAFQTKITTSFRNFITKLFNFLPEDMNKNIIFCFTYSSESCFGPGKGHKILEEFFKNELPQVMLKENCFFIDNVLFRFLVALKNNYPIEMELQKITQCIWEKSARQTNKMWDRIRENKSQNLTGTFLLYNVQKLLPQMVEPLVQLLTTIDNNLDYIHKLQTNQTKINADIIKEKIQILIQRTNRNQIEPYKEKYEVIQDILAKYAYILLKNPIKPIKNLMEQSLVLLMEQENKKIKANPNHSKDMLNSLNKIKDAHQERVENLKNAIEKGEKEAIMLDDIIVCNEKLLKLENMEYGEEVLRIIETFQWNKDHKYNFNYIHELNLTNLEKNS